MKVSGHTAAFAILKIFEENRVPKGGRLLHSDLSADWKTTGLCLSDLDEGIRIGMELGASSLEETEDGPCTTLLGKDALLKSRDRNALAAEWGAQQTQSTQQKAAKRKVTGQAPPNERRKSPAEGR